MPQYDDDLRLGPVVLPADQQSANPSPMSRGVGPLGRVYVFDIAPLASAVNNIALAQIATTLLLTAGANVTTRVGANQQSLELVLDVPRAITVTAAGANTATPTIRGFDQYGMPMTETLTAPATGAVTGKKAFKVVSSVTMSGTPGSNISVGTSGIFGLPLALRSKEYIVSANYNGAALDTSANAVVADATTATAATGDVRGTVALAATDGVKRLVMVVAVSAIQAGPNATRLGAAGVNQF